MTQGRSSSRFDEVSTLLQSCLEAPREACANHGLRVVSGPDRGAVLDFDSARNSRVLIGQSPVCELRLRDPLVSRRHAALDWTGQRLRVTDLESTNGTQLDGVSIADAYIERRGVLRVGDTSIEIERHPDATAHVLPLQTSFGRVVGASPEMRKLYSLCERIAESNVPVIIEGETGTGKEVLAESIHEMGSRSSGPFIVFDCTVAAPNLVESALFGHERGAFTGATETRRGVFEEAHGGTLLIDEIGDLELGLQAKLLRAIERSELRRVGGSRWIRVDVRVLAATRRDLDHEIQAGRFRDDLFYRLAVGRIELPPLRKRRGDVSLLANHFWTTMGGMGPFPPELAARFEDYAWPGNIRELHNAVARRIALGDLGKLGISPQRDKAVPEHEDGMDEILNLDLQWPHARQRVLDAFTRRYVARVLEKHGGSVPRAAAASGVARRYFEILRAGKRA